jgi:serine/threonine protein kinase/Tol biopolymer transport system component
MTPERYQLIDQIFQAALEIDPGRRLAFLDSACNGDEALRSEVESLITSDRGGLSFIDGPAFEMAAQVLAGDEPGLTAGVRIDRYEIVSLLGSGGMGEVYLAHDEKLDRKIALNLLPSEFTANPERVRRFQQEARAASALNHPNIITIHEIGQVDDRHFIATEFIDGETLRQHMKRETLTPDESLDIAIQVCGALAAAHKAGIVHRDIKPENIMLRADGYVKVLDFGLAKLTQQEESPAAGDAGEKIDVSSGLLMGTVKYMSPEQAQGHQVDHRSDLFSLGVVLYEMLTGRAPFEGENVRELAKAIVTDEPQPLTNVQNAARLQRITGKLLSKEKAMRHQSAAEALADLQGLDRERTSILDYARRQLKEHRLRSSVALALFAITIVGLTFGAYKLFGRRKAPFQSIAVTKLTSFGDAWGPAISPDGKYVVYAKGWGTEGPGKFSLWRRAVGDSTEVQLIPPTEIEGWYAGTTFSPDGKYVNYWVRLKGQPFAVYAVPLLGGDPKKVPLKDFPVSFSPDGKRFAYLDNRLSEGQTALVVANADGSGEHDVVTRQAPSYYRTGFRPLWSPDGKSIACVGQNGNESFARVLAVNVDTGSEMPITSQRWTAMRAVVWLPDMTGLLVAAAEETSSIFQIWFISYPGGEARRITNDSLSYWALAITGDGTTLVAQTVQAPTSFWVLPAEREELESATIDILPRANGNARQVNTATIGNGDDEGLAWTPDGKIVYVSDESGNADVWSMNADGTDRKQLTTDRHRDANANVSPDGRYIAFVSERTGVETIWLMNIDGSNQRPLTSNQTARAPVFSGDSKWVYFVFWQTGKGTIWKISTDGGDPVQVITELSFSPTISPDGKWLAYTASGKISIAPSEGGPPIKSFEAMGNHYQWAADGRSLTYLCNRCEAPRFRPNWPNLWSQAIDGGMPEQLTHFTSTGVFQYAWSYDGKQAALATHLLPSDLVLIRDVR